MRGFKWNVGEEETRKKHVEEIEWKEGKILRGNLNNEVVGDNWISVYFYSECSFMLFIKEKIIIKYLFKISVI